VIISLSWIRDFVELPKDMDAHDFANALTLSTAEVEEVRTTFPHFKQIKTVKVESLKKHPEAEKLNLVTFTDGKTSFEVVCGAPNVKPDIIVPYAAIGTTLPGGLTLEAKSIRGIMSHGMLCSAKELGLGEDQSGLMIMPSDTKLGITLDQALKMTSDELIEIDNKSLTHRPDLWGMYGFARELKTIFNLEWKKSFHTDWQKKVEKNFPTKQDTFFKVSTTKNECLSFYAIKLEGIKVGPSPQWMIDRLDACGIRSINNIVDITNYVMLEVGLPLHAYDAQKVQGPLHIKAITQNTTFTLLDGKNVELIAGDVVIADDKQPLVLAGIMGGASCGVSETTQSLILEAAVWDASRIRTTATRLGLRTDASSRFEKSMDPVCSKISFLRAIELIKELCPGLKIQMTPQYWTLNSFVEFPINISINPKRINELLGKEIPLEKMENYLHHLGFKVEKENSQWKLGVPSFRATKDISILEDIVEEMGRLVGYDSIPITSPLVTVSPVSLDKKKVFERNIQNFLTQNAQCFEVMTYPLVGKNQIAQSKWPDSNEALILVNALSEDADRMRPSLVPTLLDAVALNAKNFDSFRLFELGRSYNANTLDKIQEQLDLGIVFVSNEHQGKQLVDTVESLFRFMKLPLEVKFCKNQDLPNHRLLKKEWMGLHPYECAILHSMGQSLGFIFTVHPSLLKKYKIKQSVHVALIDAQTLAPRAFDAKTKYKPVSYLQGTYFDCCVVLEAEHLIEQPLKVVEKMKLPEVSSSKIFDVFKKDENIRFVTLRNYFTAGDIPLDASKIKELEQSIVENLNKNGFKLKQ
jgi:phenylalanyl-tRNA synthetase beta chain